MDFTISPEIDQLRREIAAFVNDRLIPLEADPASYDAHENVDESLLQTLRAEAKARGLWCLQLPASEGGRGVGILGMAICYEAMNRSIFGPVVFNSAAPDDGNMMVLNRLGTEAQKARWLRPIASGAVRSAFAMTEPAPGGGSDPSMIGTFARREGDKYIVHGRKWFITGAGVAQHFILIARTSEGAKDAHTAFLFDASQPGWRIERRIGIMGPEEHGGHCELVFEGLEIPAENILLAEGKGMRVTQTRLAPARLTHCMRWLGLAKRCIEIATEYANRREGFGQRLADRESIQLMLGDLAMRIEIGRILVAKAAWALDRGERAQAEISMAKIQCANVLHDAADRAIQINGARGYSKDTPLEWIYRYARQARLVDGADEVHRMLINRHLSEKHSDFWRWDVADAPATAAEI